MTYEEFALNCLIAGVLIVIFTAIPMLCHYVSMTRWLKRLESRQKTRTR